MATCVLYTCPPQVGNLPFRRLCKDLGCEVTCGEMAVATNLLQGQSSEWALLKRHPSEDMFGVQVRRGIWLVQHLAGRCLLARPLFASESAQLPFSATGRASYPPPPQQVCGGYPDAMARLSQLISEQVSCDFVDLNCGCPIDIICSRGAGSAIT